MRIFKIQSIERVIEWSQSRGEQLIHSSKQLGSKITRFVLGCIGGEVSQMERVRPPTRARVLDSSKSVLKIPRPLSGGFPIKRCQGLIVPDSPIGLHPCAACHWMNAWVQFLIYLPRVVEHAPFVSKAFDPFYLFLDQYLFDQKEGKPISSADSSLLFHALSKVISFEDDQLGDISSAFFQRAFPFSEGLSSCLIFRPEWVIYLDGKIQEKLSLLFKKQPLEILVGARSGENPGGFAIQRQIFPKKGSCFYDLGSFIEARSEEDHPSFIAYIKIGKLWYQCDDETVRPISSGMLGIPLQRAVLLHYKRVNV